VGPLDLVLQMGRDFAATIAADVARGGHTITSNEIASPDADVVQPCVSASPVAIKTQQTAMRIGELTIVTAPGEIFSGIAKAKVRSQAFQGGETMGDGPADEAGPSPWYGSSRAGSDHSSTMKAVTIPYMPSSLSAWVRMWQWKAHTPTSSASTSTEYRSPGATLTVSAQ
jgi:hypothetical protein